MQQNQTIYFLKKIIFFFGKCIIIALDSFSSQEPCIKSSAKSLSHNVFSYAVFVHNTAAQGIVYRVRQLGYGQDIFFYFFGQYILIKSRDFCSDFAGLSLETENRKGIRGMERYCRKQQSGRKTGRLFMVPSKSGLRIYPLLFGGHLFNE